MDLRNKRILDFLRVQDNSSGYHVTAFTTTQYPSFGSSLQIFDNDFTSEMSATSKRKFYIVTILKTNTTFRNLSASLLR